MSIKNLKFRNAAGTEKATHVAAFAGKVLKMSQLIRSLSLLWALCADV